MAQNERPLKNHLKPKSRRFALERRIVFDAALPLAGADFLDFQAPAPLPAVFDVWTNHPVETSLDTLPAQTSPDFGTPVPNHPAATEIIFIDAAVKDIQSYVTDHPNAQVVLLDAGRDGVAQIAATLAGRSGIEAVHILSHGDVGQLYLGNATLNLSSMASDHADDLATIKASLSVNADILIYGCNFGQGDRGAMATDALAALTGADVASSTDVTGNAARGGNWDLERQTGRIDTDLAVDGLGQAAYDGTFTLLVAGSPPVITAGPNSTNVGGVLTPKTTPPGDVVGSTAVWSSVASGTFGAYTGAIDLKATITAVNVFDVNDTVAFTTQDLSASILINGGANGGKVTVHWELVQAGNNTPVATSFAFTVGDIDGISATAPRETVAASTGNGLTYYSFENSNVTPSHLIVSNVGTQIKAIGTQDELASPPLSVSSIQFNWVNVSSVDFVYSIEVNPVTVQARFGMLGNNSVAFANPSVTALGLDLDADNSSTALGNDFKNTFYLGGTSIPIVDTDPSFSLPPPAFVSGTVTLTNALAGDQLLIGALPTGISGAVDTSVAGIITVTLTGSATPADYALALKAITFNNTLGSPVLTDRSIAVQLSDGSASTNAPVATIVMSPNKAPVNTLPVFNGTEDVNVSLTGLSISDANAGALEIITVTLSVPAGGGTITGAAPTGGTVSGSGTNALTLTGTLANINAYLASGTRPVYVPVADFNGVVTLTMVTIDGVIAPNTGSDTDTTTITFSPVVDTVADNLITNEETLATANVITGTGGASADNFENNTGASGRQLVAVTQGAFGTVTFLASGVVTYTPNADFTGVDSFSYTVVSGGVTETSTINVTVNPINDAPVNTLGTYTASVGSPTALTGLSVADPDSPSGAIAVTTQLTVSSGTLAATSGAGVTVTGSGTGSITLSGTIAAINAFLGATAPTFSAAAAGNVTLTMLTNDLGNIGGGALTDTDVSTISATLASAPIVDLNSAPSISVGTGTSVSNLVVNGGFPTNGNTPGAPWVEVVPSGATAASGLVTGGRWEWVDTPASNATLTQAIVVPAPTSVITASSATSTTVVATVDAITSISFDLAWQNDDIVFAYDNILSISYNGVVYATFTTFGAGTATEVGNWVYLNGASGPISTTTSVANEVTGTMTAITITLPAGVTASGNLVFTYGNGPSGAGVDDIAIDNVVVNSTKTTTTTTTNAATVDYNWTATYTENGPGVAVADIDSSVFDASDSNMEGATIKLTNAFTGDLLTVGTLPPGMVSNVNTGVAGEITVTLSGTFTKAQYADAIEQVNFSSTSENPSTTVRIINVTVNDGVLTSNTAVTTISVIAVNDAPVNALPAAQSATEDVSLAIAGVSVNDVDGNLATTQLTVLNGNVTIGALSGATIIAGVNGSATLTLSGTQSQINAALATLSYQGNLNFNGADTLSVLSTDSAGAPLSDSDNLAVNVTPVNDTPLAVADTPAAILEDSAPTTFTAASLLANDSGLGDGPVTISAVGAAVGGSVSLVAGNPVFTPAPNFNGAASFTYTITDADGQTSTASVSFSVTPVDDVVTVSGLTDGTVGGTDAQVRESDLASGTTPAGSGENTSGSFTLGPYTSLTSLTVNGGATITAAQLAASGTTPITVVSSRGTLTISAYNTATGVANYSYVLTSPANHSGGPINDSFTIATTDVEGQTVNATLAINILDDAPIARTDDDEAINIAGNPSSTASGNVVTGTGGTDPNNADGVADTLGSDATALPVSGVVAGTGTPVPANVGLGTVGTYGTLTMAASGSYTYVPNYANTTVFNLAPGATVTDTFTYEITDGDGTTALTTLTVTIVGVPAVVGLDDGSVPASDGSVLESDLTSGTQAAGGGEVLDGSFQLVAGLFPVASLTVESTTLTVAQLNNLSTTPVTLTTANGTLTLTNYAAGSGVVSYQYTLVTAPTSGSPVSDNFQVAFTDTVNNVTAPKFLRVAILDDAPVAAADTSAIAENGANPVSGNVFTNDLIGADGASVAPAGPVTGVVFGAGAPASGVGANIPVAGSYGSVTIASAGSYSYALDNANPTVDALRAGQSLTEIFTYQITDKDGSATTATLTITINGANDVPVASNDSYTMAEDAVPIALIPLANDTDVEGDVLTLSSIDGTPLTPGFAQTISVTGGVVNVSAGGSVTFTPAANFSGTINIPYSAGDGSLTSPANITIVVTPVTDLIATDDVASTSEDSPLNASVAGNDSTSSGGLLSYALASAPAHGSVTVNADGSYTYVPAPNYNGTDTFTYTVIDAASGESATKTVSLNVANVQEPPTATSATSTGNEGGLVSVSLAGTDTDGTIASVSVLTLPVTAQGVLYLADGVTPVIAGQALTPAQAASLVFKPAPGFNGVVTISFTVTDNEGNNSPPANQTIAVNSVNDLPDATPAAPSGNEDTPIPVSLSGTDIDGTIVSVVVTSLPSTAQGILYLADGVTPVVVGAPLSPAQAAGLIFKPAPNFSGAVSPIIFTVTDNQGAVSASASVNVTVNGLNDAPIAVATIANGSAGESIPLSLTATDVDGTIASITVTALPPPNQGTLTLADNTPVIAGQLLTPAQAAGLLFKANPAFIGAATLSYKATDNLGGESQLATATINVRAVLPSTTINPTTEFGLRQGLVFNSPDRLSFGLPLIPISMEYSLFVQLAVRESQNANGLMGGVNGLVTDSATANELNNFSSDLRGLPLEGNNSLFIQNVIRGLSIVNDPNLFVHHAVVQAQLESTMRDIGIAGNSNLSLPVANLWNAFDVGAMAIENVANAQSAEPASTAQQSAATESTKVTNNSVSPENDPIVSVTANLDVPIFGSFKAISPIDLITGKRAAPSFKNQVSAASRSPKPDTVFF